MKEGVDFLAPQMPSPANPKAHRTRRADSDRPRVARQPRGASAFLLHARVYIQGSYSGAAAKNRASGASLSGSARRRTRSPARSSSKPAGLVAAAFRITSVLHACSPSGRSRIDCPAARERVPTSNSYAACGSSPSRTDSSHGRAGRSPIGMASARATRAEAIESARAIVRATHGAARTSRHSSWCRRRGRCVLGPVWRSSSRLHRRKKRDRPRGLGARPPPHAKSVSGAVTSQGTADETRRN